MNDAMIQLIRIKTAVVDVYTTSPEFSLAALGTLLAVLVIVVLIYKGKKVPAGEEHIMKKGEYILSKRQKKLREHTLIADGVAAMLLDLFVKGELTPERYQYWHLRFGTQLALKELLPVKLTPVQIKEAMRKRISNGVYKPVKLPGEKAVPRPKNVIDKILSKHLS